ncbi:hypothetical protein [Clostridium neonatale]|uniref:Uncharacterized protein n=1 Tax=Clostridium neonatale TaxID=137838 RepID=A0AA86JNC2_9CLOT|nr:hypothetical protein [Clostridium neonatale]MBP8314534.1 hypothetical protein [Clostridium neonatale]CAG9705361.1 hypothetical protein CNEO_41803 [Clostridium neonatale]CAI3535267.1 hypothetical protein CNEO4_1050021 [Clostridium neonatale]CAI3535290.1 hypothetical protein CNEO4_1040003 [Clostridium neonatale]CAI3536766.1 hypothetical protein CNEO3_1160025 [Clostridium neonatale]
MLILCRFAEGKEIFAHVVVGSLFKEACSQVDEDGYNARARTASSIICQ